MPDLESEHLLMWQGFAIKIWKERHVYEDNNSHAPIVQVASVLTGYVTNK